MLLNLISRRWQGRPARRLKASWGSHLADFCGQRSNAHLAAVARHFASERSSDVISAHLAVTGLDKLLRADPLYQVLATLI
jgi:hypothetical protein